MSQDLAALAPSAIVCVAFLAGAWLLLRRELAPRRRARGGAGAIVSQEDASPATRPMAKGAIAPGVQDAVPSGEGQPAAGEGKGLYFTASWDYVVSSIGYRRCADADIGCAEFAHSIPRTVPYVYCAPLT